MGYDSQNRRRLLDSVDFLGKTFNRLTIIEDLGWPLRDREVMARCECGIIKSYLLNSIKSGNSKSCGCLKSDLSKIRNKTHGLLRHPLYKVWQAMKNRCYNERYSGYANYGGNGVVICEVWRSDFKSFYDWAIDKWKPGLQLDKDKLSPFQTGKEYSPEYCCFITPAENKDITSRTVLIELNGTIKSLSSWRRELKVGRYEACKLIKTGKWKRININQYK